MQIFDLENCTSSGRFLATPLLEIKVNKDQTVESGIGDQEVFRAIFVESGIKTCEVF